MTGYSEVIVVIRGEIASYLTGGLRTSPVAKGNRQV
jgi:hypothetical protein